MANEFTIRNAKKSDAQTILKLIKELAIYEKAEDQAVASEEDILRDGFGENPRFHCIIIEEGTAAQAAGFALYYYNWSTWTGKSTLFLEDLYVREEARSKGYGLALLKKLAEIAKTKHCARMCWNVLDWNTLAINFYKKLEAEILEEWRLCRLEERAIHQLAVIDLSASRSESS